MTEIEQLLLHAQNGDLAAYGKVVKLTQHMVFAVCLRVLRNHAEALDATQETYLHAFQRLDDLREHAAFPGWLRRIAITTAQNIARKRRFTFLQSTDIPDIPIFDEMETTWSESQRHALAHALLKLSPEDRRICDRFYHGGWDIARLAADARITETAMRKRLQRMRDQLRKDAEMTEQQNTKGLSLPPNLPSQVIELLARPKLIDLPENPVGRITRNCSESVTPPIDPLKCRKSWSLMKRAKLSDPIPNISLTTISISSIPPASCDSIPRFHC